MITLLLHLLLLPFLLGGHRQLALENLALRHQLSVYKRTTTRPKLRTIMTCSTNIARALARFAATVWTVGLGNSAAADTPTPGRWS